MYLIQGGLEQLYSHSKKYDIVNINVKGVVMFEKVDLKTNTKWIMQKEIPKEVYK